MSKYRIMVVDDDPDIRFVVTGLLGTDFETVQAENGLDALEKLERYEPDLALLDIGMPIMDGFAACSAIRRHAEFADLPVFFLSARAKGDVRERAEAVGSQGYVEKPFETQELIQSIRAFFAEHRQPPRLKLFTMRELAKIDATPLKAAGRAGEDEPPAESGHTPLPLEIPQDDSGHRKTRKTFGAPKPKAAEPKVEAPPPPPPTAKLPPAPPPTAKMPPPAPPPPPPTAKVTPPAPKSPEPAPPAPPPVAPAPAAAPPPAAEAPKPAPEPVRPRRKIPEAAKAGSGAPKGPRPRVLCLVTGRDDMMAYTEGLKGRGEFLPLEDPVEAIEIIARFQPDIVITPVQTASFSGLQLAQLMQGNPRLSHTEVIFAATGREPDAARRLAERLSRNTRLALPPPVEAVQRAIDAIVSKSGFRVRDKKHGYGVYVEEVLRKERERKEDVRKLKEREAYKERDAGVAQLLSEVIKNMKPGDAPDRPVRNLQSYYLQYDEDEKHLMEPQ